MEIKKYNNITIKQLQDILDTHISDKGELYEMYKEHHTDTMTIRDELKYSKRVFLSGKMFRHDTDLLNTVLDDDKKYTINEVRGKILDFKRRKVGDI